MPLFTKLAMSKPIKKGKIAETKTETRSNANNEASTLATKTKAKHNKENPN